MTNYELLVGATIAKKYFKLEVSMQKLKVFQCNRDMSDFQNADIMDSMTQEVNDAIAKWVKKEKIENYQIVNSQLTATNQFEVFGNLFVGTMVLSTHLIY